jgi:pimeloyl-ACP methyl ester carboxylesterase
MFIESYTKFKGDTVFNLARLNGKEVLIVFFHGIGDSHLNFECFFYESSLNSYDIFIADLLGHGFSSKSEDYSFLNQCMAIKTQLEAINLMSYKKIIFIPHSMGVIHALLLLSQPFNISISALIAIDTTVSSKKSFVAKKVEEIIEAGEDYDMWFEWFKNWVFNDLATKDDALKKYFAGLLMVRKECFKSNALELRKMVKSNKPDCEPYIIGNRFTNLEIPKLYCTGEDKSDDIIFLKKHHVEVKMFNTHSHFVAQACLKEFTDLLTQFISKF